MEIIKLRPYFEIHENWAFETFSFWKKRPRKRHFFQMFELFLFPTELWCEFDSWHVWKHSGALSKKCSVANLG